MDESKATRLSTVYDKNKIDFKIEDIQLQLRQANYNGKILKMKIEENIYFTETSKHVYTLRWEGKGYFFPKVSIYSILYIELIE